MSGDEKRRRPRRPSATRMRHDVPKADKILSVLTRFKPPAPAVAVPPASQRYRFKCAACKDVGRVRGPGKSAVTRPCSACDAGFEPDPSHAEKFIDSMILKRRPR